MVIFTTLPGGAPASRSSMKADAAGDRNRGIDYAEVTSCPVYT